MRKVELLGDVFHFARNLSIFRVLLRSPGMTGKGLVVLTVSGHARHVFKRIFCAALAVH